jgi:endoglucanase
MIRPQWVSLILTLSMGLACGGNAKIATAGTDNEAGSGGSGGAQPRTGNLGGSGASRSSTASERPFVHVQGTELVRGTDGAAFRFRGVTFTNYYWLSGDAMRSATEHTLDSYAEIAGWGMNAVQLLLSYRLFEDDSTPGVYSAEGWQWLDANVAAAKQAGLVVVLDLITPPGGDWHDQSTPEHDFRLWTDARFSDRFVSLWKAIAARYAAEETVAAFGLLNEPVTLDADGTSWWSLAERTVSAIRSVDPNHVIVIDPLYGTNGTYGVPPSILRRRRLADNNLLYDVHFYEPADYTHQGAHWTTGVGTEGGKYPDPSRTQVVGDLIYRTGTKGDPSLPPGTTDWNRYEGVKFAITDPSIRVSYPSVSCSGMHTGIAYFDEFEVVEFDSAGNRLGTIGTLSVTKDTLGLWYPWSSNGTGTLSSVPEGHLDESALSIAGSTAMGLFSTRQLLFAVTTGNQYQVTGWMRGDDIAAGVSCQFRLEFYSLGASATLTARNRELLTAKLDGELAFGADNGVPMAVTEFGLMRKCFEEDRGGLAWVADLLDLLDRQDISYFFFPYHSTSMGIYGDEARPPDTSTRNDALVNLFRSRLSPQDP